MEQFQKELHRFANVLGKVKLIKSEPTEFLNSVSVLMKKDFKIDKVYLENIEEYRLRYHQCVLASTDLLHKATNAFDEKQKE